MTKLASPTPYYLSHHKQDQPHHLQAFLSTDYYRNDFLVCSLICPIPPFNHIYNNEFKKLNQNPDLLFVEFIELVWLEGWLDFNYCSAILCSTDLSRNSYKLPQQPIVSRLSKPSYISLKLFTKIASMTHPRWTAVNYSDILPPTTLSVSAKLFMATNLQNSSI